MLNTLAKWWADLSGVFADLPARFNDLLTLLKVPTILVGGFTLSAVIVLLCGALFFLAFYAVQQRRLPVKFLTVTVLVCALFGFVVAMIEQLSHPKPLSMAWLQAQGEKGISIDASKVVPPYRIYIWMEVEGEQRNYYIPWSKSAEESLKKALEARKGRQGQGGDLRLRFEKSLETEPQFYETPWPAPPPKDGGGGEEQAPPQRPLIIEREA